MSWKHSFYERIAAMWVKMGLWPDLTKLTNSNTIEGMTRWFRVRQKALDDAKRNTPHKKVSIYYHIEVNLSDLAVRGKGCVINSILHNLNPDYVSFSSFTAINPPANECEMDSTLTVHLNYIQSKIKPKSRVYYLKGSLLAHMAGLNLEPIQTNFLILLWLEWTKEPNRLWKLL